jgi:hypothetical protein
LFLFIATIEGSLTTIPLPRAKTSVFAVPRSMARSEENRLNKERILIAACGKLLRASRGANWWGYSGRALEPEARTPFERSIPQA